MTTIELDLHKRESQFCIGFDDGRIEERRIARALEVPLDVVKAFALAASRRPENLDRTKRPLVPCREVADGNQEPVQNRTA